MSSTAEVQAGLKKFAPVGIFSLSMILLGSLVNKFPPDEESLVIGKDFNCLQIPRGNISAAAARHSLNQSIQPLVPTVGLAFILFALPLTPLLFPALSSGIQHHQRSQDQHQNLESNLGFETRSAFGRDEVNRFLVRFALQLFVGQAACFGSSELARHYILQPDLTFFEKCNLPRNKCKQLQSLGVLTYRVGGNSSTSSLPLLCPDSETPKFDLHNSLHSLPNADSTLVGSSLVMFVLGMWLRRKIDLELSKRRSQPVTGILLQRQYSQVQGSSEGDATRRSTVEAPSANPNTSVPLSRKGLLKKLARLSNPYVKVLLLLLTLSLLTLLLVDRYRQHKNTSLEVAGSIVCGMVVQCFVNILYALKKEN